MEKLKDKYISETDSKETIETNKKIISDDAFAVCEFLEDLSEKLTRGLIR